MFISTSVGRIHVLPIAVDPSAAIELTELGDLESLFIRAANALVDGEAFRCELFSFAALGYKFVPEIMLVQSENIVSEDASVRIIGSRTGSIADKNILSGVLYSTYLVGNLQAYASIVSVDKFASAKGVGLTARARAQRERGMTRIRAFSTLPVAMSLLAEDVTVIDSERVMTSQVSSFPVVHDVITHVLSNTTPLPGHISGNRESISASVASAYNVPVSSIADRFTSFGVAGWFEDLGYAAVFARNANFLMSPLAQSVPTAKASVWGLLKTFNDVYSVGSKSALLAATKNQFRRPLGKIGVEIGPYQTISPQQYFEALYPGEGAVTYRYINAIRGLNSLSTSLLVGKGGATESLLSSLIASPIDTWPSSLLDGSRTNIGDTFILNGTNISINTSSEDMRDDTLELLCSSRLNIEVMLSRYRLLSQFLSGILEATFKDSFTSALDQPWTSAKPSAHLARVGVKHLLPLNGVIVENWK